MPRKCAVLSCHSPKKSTYHSFPKDPTLRQMWVEVCEANYKNSKIDPGKAKICQYHFKESDYQRDLPHELLGLPLRKILCPGVVPSQRLTEEENLIAINEKPRVVIYSKKQQHHKVEVQPTTTTGPSATALGPPAKRRRKQQLADFRCELKTDPDYEVPARNGSTHASTMTYNSHADNQISKLKLQIQEYRGNEEALKTRLRLMSKTVTLQSREISAMRKRIRTLTSETYMNLYVKRKLGQTMTQAQIKCLMNNSNRTSHWSEEDLRNGAELRNISEKAYTFIREKKLLPLPGVTTLRCYQKSRGAPSDTKEIQETSKIESEEESESSSHQNSFGKLELESDDETEFDEHHFDKVERKVDELEFDEEDFVGTCDRQSGKKNFDEDESLKRLLLKQEPDDSAEEDDVS